MIEKLEVLFHVFLTGIQKMFDWIEGIFYLKPDDESQIYSRIGTKLSNKGNATKAISNLKKAVELSSSNLSAWNELGLVYLKNKSYDDAITCFQKVISTNSNHNPEIYYHLGFAYNKKGMIDEAIKFYTKSLNIEHNQHSVHYQLGLIYAGQKNYDNAISSYEKAIEFGPTVSKYYYSLGLSYDAKGEHGKAIESFRKAMEIEENG